MGCTSSAILAGVAYDCADIPVGGLKTIYICRLDKAQITIVDENSFTVGVIATGDVVELEFNNKDGFSAFTEEKTVEPSGVTTSVPTVVVEFPKMTKAKRDELNQISTSGLDLAVFVETASGTRHAIGLIYGARATLVSGASGTGRSEKNMYQITFTGEEDIMSYDIDEITWAAIQVGL